VFDFIRIAYRPFGYMFRFAFRINVHLKKKIMKIWKKKPPAIL